MAWQAESHYGNGNNSSKHLNNLQRAQPIPEWEPITVTKIWNLFNSVRFFCVETVTLKMTIFIVRPSS